MTVNSKNQLQVLFFNNSLEFILKQIFIGINFWEYQGNIWVFKNCLE